MCVLFHVRISSDIISLIKFRVSQSPLIFSNIRLQIEADIDKPLSDLFFGNINLEAFCALLDLYVLKK